MAGRSLFDARPVGAVSVVEPPVSLWYVKRARLAFVCVSLACWAVVGAVASAFMSVLFAVALGLVAGVALGLLVALVVRVWPVLRVLWWWSLEITTAAVVVSVVALLVRVWPWWLVLTLVGLLVASVLLCGPVRRFVVAWSWCVVDRHRLRLCFTQIVRASTKGGSSRPPLIPWMLWARPTLAGTRVWVWLRLGLSLDDLEGKTGQIAVACFGASQVRVDRARENLSALVRIDVTRRDPLTGLVPSPLAFLVGAGGADDDADVPVSPAIPLVGLDLADVPEPPAAESSRGGGRR